MEIKIGCDIVQINKFKHSASRGGKNFLNRIFTVQELKTATSPQSLAGVFAAKEAVVKALGLEAGDWQSIEILKNRKGRPDLKLHQKRWRIASSDLSISHDVNYVFAIAVFLIHES